MITDVAHYFEKGCGRCARFDTPDCATRHFAEGLAALRQLCREAGLEETAKWGHPCYMHAGRNIAIIGAFRDNFRLTFFNAALMKDPEGLLQRQGPNTAHPDMIRFAGAEDVATHATTIRAYLDEAMAYAEQGLKPPRDTRLPDMPVELSDTLDADPELAEAFAALTPGRQKSYLLNLNAAKAPETRLRRIEKFRDKIIAGKGAQERY